MNQAPNVTENAGPPKTTADLHPYLYEQDAPQNSNTKRDEKEAKQEAKTMLVRLDVPVGLQGRLFPESGVSPSDPAERRAQGLLLRYATDVHLNLRWYQRAQKEQHRARAYWTAATVVVAIVTMALPLLLFAGHVDPKDTPVLTAQLAMVATAVGTAWKFILNLNETKARFGIFWNAFAELREELLSFEEAWRGKATVDAPAGQGGTASGVALSPEFLLALIESLHRARATARKERDDFFATYKGPDDILKAGATASSELLAARDALLKAQAAVPAPDAASKAVEEALAKARLEEAAKAAALEAAKKEDKLVDAESARSNLEAARKAYVTAKAARVEAEAKVLFLKKA
jgi:hypothetical protein